MTDKELRELDAWIAEHVFCIAVEWLPMDEGNVPFPKERELSLSHYTTDPAAAMEVLKKCVVKSGEKYDQYCPDAIFCIYPPLLGEMLWTVSNGAECGITGDGETLEIAICQFAKQIFSK